ncbi:MAG TPA: cupin domain-containing protein [Streptosporangiaceae bacterium]|nr:cupin domain-containing protein [Streptosporangiaceae bacterium]
MLLLTTLEAWQTAPDAPFVLGDAGAAWAPADDVLAIADDAFPVGQVIAITLAPEPVRVPLPGVIDRSSAVHIRYARRGPAGRHVALLERPAVAAALDLVPHPEGGWFRETWKTSVRLSPEGHRGDRASATGIYFLLPPGEESLWHVVASDELWLWHRGGPLNLIFGGTGEHPATPWTLTLGPGIEGGQHPQALVPAGHWQSAKPATSEAALVSCVVSPGFDFADFRTL